MNILRKISTVILFILLLISLMNTFYEYDNSKRLSKNDTERYNNGTYKEFYRSFDTLMENRVNTSNHRYDYYKYELTIELTILFLIIFLLSTNRMNKRRNLT
jgi:hypothetical protein